MTDTATAPGQLGPYRFWGDRKPDTERPLLTFTRAKEETADASTEAGRGSDVGTEGVATLRIYGPIDSWGGFWGVSAKDVSQALDALGAVGTLVVRVNSPGGEAFEGRAIMNLLRAHSAHTVAVVDGLAASAASYVAVGCDETVMAPGTMLMIHDTSSFVYGNADEMRKAADVLESISRAGSELYADVAGGTPEHWREIQRAETWYTAAEAVESGLADRVGIVADTGPAETAADDETVVVVEPEGEDRVDAEYDLSIFTYAGREKAPAPKPPSASAVGQPPHPTETESAVAFSDEQMKNMRAKLGIAEDADEATIVAALDEALDEQVAEHTPTAPELPEGHVAIPAAKLADLEAAATLATSTAKSLHDKERDAFLDSVRNKYLPTSRDGWAAEYDRDEAGVRAHFEKAAVLIPTSEAGHAGQPENTEDDELYALVFGDEKKGA